MRMIRKVREIDWRSLRVRIVGTVGAFLVVLGGLWCWDGWRSDRLSMERELRSRCEGIAATATVPLDGDVHRVLAREVPNNVEPNALPFEYQSIREPLLAAKEANGIEAEITTLELRDQFRQGVEKARDRVHQGALVLRVTTGDVLRWKSSADYVPSMAPAFFERKVSSSEPYGPPQARKIAGFAPIVDSFDEVAGIVRVEVPWTSSLLTALLFLGLRIGIVAALVGTILFSTNTIARRALRPIAKLENAVGDLAAGHWQKQVEVEAKASELSVLASAMEALRLGVVTRFQEARERIEKLRGAKEEAEKSLQGHTRVLNQLGGQVRRPLAAFTDSLRRLESIPLDAEPRSKVDGAILAAYGLSARVEHALQSARLETGARTPARDTFDLARLVERTAAPARAKGRSRGVPVRLIVPETLPAVLVGDSGALQDVLVQLLENALAATTEGSITLRVWPTASQGEDMVLRFEVADTGHGVPPEARARIETALQEGLAFARREKERVGLARASELVRLLGGEMAFESRPGAGSRFWFFGRFQPAPADAPKAPLAGSNGAYSETSARIHGAS